MDRIALMLRGHALAGTAASTALFLVGLASAFQPGLDPWREPISNLALGPGRWLVAAAFWAGGVGCLALAIALHRVLGTPSWPATAAMALGGACIVLLGVFPTDGQVVPRTAAGRVHAVAAALGFALVEASLLMHGRLLRARAAWRPVARVLDPLAWASLALLGVSGVLALGSLRDGSYWPMIGLAERLLVACMLAWTFLASLGLIRHAGRAQAP